EAGIEPGLRQLESFLDDKCSVGVVEQVVFGDAMVFDGVVNEAAEERNIRTCANLAEQVGNRGRARETRVYHDQFGVACAFCLDGPLEAAGMVLRRIPTHDQHHVSVLDVDPSIGHSAPAERWSQT